MPDEEAASTDAAETSKSSARTLFWSLLTIVCLVLIAAKAYYQRRAEIDEPLVEVQAAEQTLQPEQAVPVLPQKTTPRQDEQATAELERVRATRISDPRRIPQMNVMGWWDNVPEIVKQKTLTHAKSNMHPSDYVAAESCQKCHEKNYASWSEHPHRWMNALADDKTVKGDFSGSATINYYGGEATFARDDDRYVMHLQRASLERTYRITQTIGSRFFQYYVGVQTAGPEPQTHRAYSKHHVLPFGYWLAEKQWVPVVHVGPELPDSTRPDPFDPPETAFFEYSRTCNFCHTTFAVGDMLTRQPGFVGFMTPAPMHWNIAGFLQQEHPEVMQGKAQAADFSDRELTQLLADVKGMHAPDHAVSLGVSCGACHLGAKAHVASEGKQLPQFFPTSPHLYYATNTKRDEIDYGRTQYNVNWACGRCHIGPRPQFAVGASTWNSTEFSDAVQGSCYTQLRCIDCHNPHQRIGTKESPNWEHSATFDDGKCLKCHEQFRADQALTAHTHHTAGSTGSRCMNCHMPRINEGLQDVVRTHTIFSPTQADMIESNHPNACNMCHTNESIGWTVTHLQDWYGAKFNDAKIAAAYSSGDQSVAIGWLGSDNEAVRLVGADALIRMKNHQSLAEVVKALDDPFLVNRQFAAKGLEEWLDVELSDYGYHFYMRPGERDEPLKKVREALLSIKAEESSAQAQR